MSIDNTYVQKLMARLTDMLMIATNKPAIPYSDVFSTPPFWMVFPRSFTDTPQAEGTTIQTWRIAIIYAVSPSTAGYRGEYQQALYVDVPAAINYIQAHSRLTYQGNEKIDDHLDKDTPYFQSGKVTPVERGSHFGVTTADRILGYEMDYVANFKIYNPANFA